MAKGKYLTISVDDGHPKDIKTAELLNKYELKATFYIPKINPEKDVMEESDIKKIAELFEIGGHTYHHKSLHGLPREEIQREVQDGKNWLEQLLNREIISFCYPRGKLNKIAIEAVKDTGFKGARTCMYHLNDFPKNPFVWGVSTHAYSHPKIIQIRHALIELNIRGLINFFLIQKGCVDWVKQFKFAVDDVEQNGGIAHLYFHSWEIEELNEWKQLEDLFRYLAKKIDLKRVTNGNLFEMWYRMGRKAE